MSGGARPGGGALVAALVLGLGCAAARAADLTALATQPLPLAIRDGRVARLTVHAVPFALGSKDLPPEAAQGLDMLAAQVATDCFLTAQAIGHVRPGTPGDGETLAAHRLARARAEAVQAALVKGGLPAASVASVWDYQFSIREPRVTLWVFSLPEGDECTGAPLPGAPVRLAAAEPSLPSVEPAAAPPEPVPLQAAERSLEPAPGIHLGAPEVEPMAGLGPAPAKAAPTETAPAAAAPRAPAAAGAALPEPIEASAAELPETVVPAPPAAPVATAEIVFEPNSSYFPRGGEADLRRLLEALPPGKGYAFELAAAVDDTVYRVDDPAKALAYNEWLANRRQGRVADWLEQHVEAREVQVERVLLPHDASRRVVIRARPVR